VGYGPQNGVRIGLFTLKLDLWTAFGYTGFSVEGLLGIGAFGYTVFSVVTPVSQKNYALVLKLFSNEIAADQFFF
jgi:hypothetical protein